MKMPSGKQPVNCVPCAQRKVRCNRLQPCSHCQRRKGDVCTYPAQRPKGHPFNRLEKLELYVRRLGGDPELIKQDENALTSIDESGTSNDSSARVHSVNRTASPGPKDIQSTNGLDSQKSGLIDHNDQTTYIELPMWYSWNGVKKPGGDPQGLDPAQINQAKPIPKAPHACSTLFDPISLPDRLFLHSVYPSAIESTILWKTYLENVHPLVMIFFDWETEVIIAKAGQNPTGLKEGEQALTFGIYFIATLSLSERECLDILHVQRSYLLDKFQKAVEDSLLLAELLVTSDRLVLQAFMLYLLAMRNRARPAAIFSLTGIASRIAERVGLHRDGTTLNLSHLRSEERRRMWWQLQHMELSAAQSTGSVTMTIYSDWDTALPHNLSDHDFHPDMVDLPPERPGLTIMSHCLWRYQILHMQRVTRQPNGVVGKALSWMLSPQISLGDKDAMIDTVEKALGEKFLQHCEPLIPLHVHIQIGVRAFILAARWVARQPALINARISQMSVGERDDLLRICMKSLEYYVLAQKTEMLRRYSWHAYNYFQWAAFVYMILEAHHRPSEAITNDLWSLISNIYSVHPTLGTATHHPDITCIVRITLAAYRKRHVYIVEQYQQRNINPDTNGQSNPLPGPESASGPGMEPQPPQWIQNLKQKFNLSDMTESSTLSPEPTAAASEPKIDDPREGLLPPDFDFDMIDWQFWEHAGMDAVV